MAKLIPNMLWVLTILPAVAVAAPASKKAPMRPPVTYANSGITIAVPEGFEFRPITSPFDVFKATIEESGRAVRAVTLAAFPLSKAISAEEFAEGKMAELARNVLIRNLKTARKTAMKVAGANGAVRLVSYSFRGTDSVAAQVYFLREVAGTRNRLCYLLTVVTTAEKKDTLIPALAGVITSVNFSDVKAPQIPKTVELTKERLQDPALGFSLHLPKDWYIDRSGGGVESGLINYRQGGIPLPSVKVTAGAAPADSTSQSASAKYLTLLKSAAVQNKQDTRTISDAKATLGALSAWQFVLQIMEKPNPIPSLGGKQAEDVIIIHRTACMMNKTGRLNVAYTITITAKATERAEAQSLMDVLAKTFEATGPGGSQAETQPTTAPTSAPATKPAN